MTLVVCTIIAIAGTVQLLRLPSRIPATSPAIHTRVTVVCVIGVVGIWLLILRLALVGHVLGD